MKNNLKNSWIVHHITYQCDNDCSFCIVQDRLKNKQPALSELLEEMHNIETAERYYFTGGEPTKRDDLGLLIKKARTKSVRSLRDRIGQNVENVKSARRSTRKSKNVDLDDLDLTI